MARPQKQGIDYFPFDVDFFDDDKVEAISGEFGVKGELATIKLLCAIYRNGYYIVWNELAKMKLTKRLHGVSPELLDTIVLRLIKWEFFNEGLFRSAQVLSSTGIQKRWREATRKRVDKKDSELEYWLLDVSGGRNEVSGGRNSQEEEFPAEETTQSKVKESIVNEIKGDKSNNSLSPLAAAPVKKDFKTPVLEVPSKEKKNLPPSSAVPPSLVRDENGVATCQELRKSLLEYQEKNPELYKNSLYREFLKYWSEPNDRNVPRWKTEKTKKGGRFDIAGRLSTWYSKSLENGSNRNTPTYRGSGSSLRPMGQAEPQYRGGRPLPDVEL